VTAAEIGGLDPLEGYLQHGNLVVRMRFPRMEPEERAERFIDRKQMAVSAQSRPQAVRVPDKQQQEQARVGHPYFE